jgi:g-D-glutamyl-meso-diaminopimelate peptidase
MEISVFINFEKIYTFNEILNKSIKLAGLYSGLVSLIHIGKSNDDREIFMIKLGKGEKGALYISGVHAREIINPCVMLKIIENYIHNYYSIGEQILDDYSLFFIPILNPDGYVIATEGYTFINNVDYRNISKSTGIANIEYKLNANAVDINRNFNSKSYIPTKVSGIADNEPETKALINACKKYNLLGMIDFHSRGNAIFYHREALDYEYNKRQFDIACELAKISGYKLYAKTEENTDGLSGGNTVNFFSEFYHRPSITIETVSEDAEFPLNRFYYIQVYREIKNIPRAFLKILINT